MSGNSGVVIPVTPAVEGTTYYFFQTIVSGSVTVAGTNFVIDYSNFNFNPSSVVLTSHTATASWTGGTVLVKSGGVVVASDSNATITATGIIDAGAEGASAISVLSASPTLVADGSITTLSVCMGPHTAIWDGMTGSFSGASAEGYLESLKTALKVNAVFVTGTHDGVALSTVGTVSIAPDNKRVLFQPPVGFTGTTKLAYELVDAFGNIDEALVTVTATPKPIVWVDNYDPSTGTDDADAAEGYDDANDALDVQGNNGILTVWRNGGIANALTVT